MKRKSVPFIQPFGREKLARMAKILGPSASATTALANFDGRVARGIATDCYILTDRRGHTTLIVGDPIRDSTYREKAGEK